MIPPTSQHDAPVKAAAAPPVLRRLRSVRSYAGRAVRFVIALIIPVLVPACGISATQIFPNQLVGADGQRFTVDDLRAIARDADLDAEGKREAFRDLGILDEKLIDALLNL